MDSRILFIFCLIVNFAVPLDIECTYSLCDFHAVGHKYECLVKNNILIDSPENAGIKTFTGTHMNGKDDDSEIYFRISNKEVQYFPRGMEKFFKNLRGIVIWYTQLKEIHQEDLKPYSKLSNLYLAHNDIEVIEDGLFDYNPDMQVIIMHDSKIFHISSTVFDNLKKLTTLNFSNNKCTKLTSKNDREATITVINSVKGTCKSANFLNLMKKLENLEEISEVSFLANSQIFIKNVIDFQTEFKNSKFANFSPLKQNFRELLKMKIKSPSDAGQCEIVAQLKHKIEKDLEDSQQNILKAVDIKIEDLESRLTGKMEDILNEKLGKIMADVKKIINML